MRFPSVSSKDVVRVLRKAGFSDAPKRGKGSHLAFYRERQGRKSLVIVPKRSELPRGTLTAILEQAGLTRDEFMRLLQ